MKLKHTKEGHKLQELIKKAIDDSELTMSEYEEILAQAHGDGHVDKDEESMLHELHELIANGTVKRVPG